MTYSDTILDRALAKATPVYPAARTGALPALSVGQHCYLLADDGLFVMGQGNGFVALIRVADLPRTSGFGPLAPGIWFEGRPVPPRLIEEAKQHAIETYPKEWAGAITLSTDGWTMEHVGVTSASGSHVTYGRSSYRDDALVVDVHSHGAHPAGFSPTDNASDEQGVHIAAVLGECQPETIRLIARVSVNGFFLDIEPGQWLDIHGDVA